MNLALRKSGYGMRTGVPLLSAMIAELPLEVFLEQVAHGGQGVPGDPRHLQDLEVLGSALLRVKETAVAVQRAEAQRK